MGRVRHVHMVGIGGIGMSSIAEVLLARGFVVSGSDLNLSDVTEHLESQGATVFEGHASENVTEADVVVYSSAVRIQENVETIEANRRRIPLINRAEMLAELMRMNYGIGVAGTHGKTTTTTMVGHVAKEAGLDPTIVVGGKVTEFGSNALSGEGDVMVVEADEYDRTFLKLTPVFAVVTSIEVEHLDTYENLEDIKRAFVQFADSVPFFGAAILCLDDENVRSILHHITCRVVTFGMSRQATIRAENVEYDALSSRFDVWKDNDHLGSVALQAPGKHNVLNALAAVAVGLELDIAFEAVARGIARYAGVRRRFEVLGEPPLGEEETVLVVDDYAHHPTEVRATLAAASRGWPERRIVAVFQPHLYSRTQDLADEFARSFYDADVLILTDVYPAREEPIPGVSGELVAEGARRVGHRDVRYVPDKEELPETVAEIARGGDMVLTMGAGDIWRVGRKIHALLSESNGIVNDPAPQDGEVVS